MPRRWMIKTLSREWMNANGDESSDAMINLMSTMNECKWKREKWKKKKLVDIILDNIQMSKTHSLYEYIVYSLYEYILGVKRT